MPSITLLQEPPGIDTMFSERLMRQRKRRYQDPKILKTKNRKSPNWYYIRVHLPDKVSPLTNEITYKEHREYLCLVSDGINKAKQEKTRYLATLNTDSLVPGHIKFAEFAEIYKKQHLRSPLSEATIYNQTTAINAHLIPRLGPYKLSAIDGKLLKEWMESLESPLYDEAGKLIRNGLAQSTRVLLRGLLSTMFNEAVRMGYLAKNPVQGLSAGKKERKHIKAVPSPEEIQELLENLSERTRLIVLLSYTTGMRIGEVRGLEWSAFNFQRGTVSIHQRAWLDTMGPVKSDATKRIKRLGFVQPLLLAWREKHPDTRFVFEGSDGEPVPYVTLLRDLKQTAEKLGMDYEGFGFHLFRHTHITYLQEEGIHPLEVAKSAGKASIHSLLPYTGLRAAREDHFNRLLEEKIKVGKKSAETEEKIQQLHRVAGE